MVFCPHCGINVAGDQQDDGNLCCNRCGRVLQNQFFSQEATFVKNSAGQSKLSGNYVKSVLSEFASRERTLAKALDEIKYLSHGLGVEDESLAKQAVRFYNIALDRNFTRGRKSELVHAACLYISFRLENKPFLLIDFSNLLSTNVYVLGAVFLQLCELLRLGEHPIVQKPVDPSLFINKYTTSLLKQRNVAVSQAALNIIARMKRDWMQTGRKPSGLCGAALYIAALAHGFKFSKTDILRIVHVCEATLTKRLVEFENTESSRLTIEELNTMAREHQESPLVKPNGEFGDSTSKDLVCEHKNTGVAHFALGLCDKCYQDFVDLSGGLSGGLNPPAFQRAEKERMKKKLSKESANESHDASNSACKGHKEDLTASVLEWDNVEHDFTKDDDCTKEDDFTKDDESHREEETNAETHGESESLSDIDDQEVDGYIVNNEIEKEYKRIIWENLNREYVEEQAAKEAAAAAAKKAFEANFENCSDDLQAARELAASATAAVAKSRKEMRQKRAIEAKSSGPAQSAAEAARRMVTKKRLSSKVNFDCLEKLFDMEPGDAGNPKKVRFDLPSDHDHEDKSSSKVEDNKDDEFEDDDMGGAYENNWYPENDDSYYPEDGGYNYYDDDDQY